MAKSAFSKRFPYARLFLLTAILVGLSLTVWSFLKVSTTTQEHAAAATCTTLGGSCFYGQCSPGYTSIPGSTSTTCNSNGIYQCCTPTTLPAPITTSSTVTECRSHIDYGVLFPQWKPVQYAARYTVYWRFYSATKPTIFKAVNVGNKTSPQVETNGINGRAVEWTVQAVNNYTSGATSPLNRTRVPTSGC